MIGSRSRSRSRHRGPGSRWNTALVLLLAVSIIVALGGPGLLGASLTTGSVFRPVAGDVVIDGNGAHNLNVTTGLQEAQASCLVEVTNHLGDSVTVTVSLADDSKSLGTLRVSVADTVESGDSVEFSLSEGETQTVQMDAGDDTNGSTVSFHANATGTAIDVGATNRNAPIKKSADTSCK